MNKVVRMENGARKRAPTPGTISVDGKTQPCAMLTESLAIVGDKWTVLVVGTLSTCKPGATMRYSEVLRSIDGISQRMLTLTLKGLEENGLVKRTIFPTVPPRVDYELTPLGRTLIKPLHALHEWTLENREALKAARHAYAAKKAE